MSFVNIKMMNFDQHIKIQDRLVEYAKGYSDKPWQDWPTVAELARRYKVKQSDIVDIAEGHDNLDLIVGMRTGSGHGAFATIGEYRVEWFGT